MKDAEVMYEKAPTPAAMIRTGIECLESQTAKNWQAKRDEALRALRKAEAWVGSHILHEERVAFRKA